MAGPARRGLDPDRRFPANSLVSTLQQFATLILVPALGGIGTAALGSLLAYPRVAVVLLVAFVFYAAYGPFEVAVPLQVRSQLHGDAALLGQLWTSPMPIAR